MLSLLTYNIFITNNLYKKYKQKFKLHNIIHKIKSLS